MPAGYTGRLSRARGKVVRFQNLLSNEGDRHVPK